MPDIPTMQETEIGQLLEQVSQSLNARPFLKNNHVKKGWGFVSNDRAPA
jgi:hypothetical protein